MSGDYSRKRFNPENHYQGVLRQQGRVDLDADWNEYVDLQDRHWRAETHRCHRPLRRAVGNAGWFQDRKSGNQFTIGQGRHLRRRLARRKSRRQSAVQFHSGRKLWHRADSGERAALRCRDLTVPAQQRLLVYLDVWRREVTHLQDPSLIEPAVNVDTTTRYQTAWQVKVLGDIAADVTCQTRVCRYRQMAEGQFAVGGAPDHDDSCGEH